MQLYKISIHNKFYFILFKKKSIKKGIKIKIKELRLSNKCSFAGEVLYLGGH